MDNDKFLRLETVASELDVSIQTVRNLINRGVLKGTRLTLRSGLRVKREDLDKLLQELRDADEI